MAVTGKVKEVDWYEISLPEDKKGYVSGSLLSSEKPKEVIAQTPAQEQPKQEQTQPPVQKQQPSYGDEQLPPGVLPGQSYDPETGRVWQPGDDTGGGNIYLGNIDDLDLSDWGN